MLSIEVFGTVTFGERTGVALGLLFPEIFFGLVCVTGLEGLGALLVEVVAGTIWAFALK
jgi:hypothetical protein